MFKLFIIFAIVSDPLYRLNSFCPAIHNKERTIGKGNLACKNLQLHLLNVSSFALQIWNNVGNRVNMKSQETLRNLKTCIQEVCKNIGASLQR